MSKRISQHTGWLAVLLMAVAAPALAQSRIFVDLPSGDTYSDTTDPAPAATVELDLWEAIDGFGGLTGDSVRPSETASFADATASPLTVTVEIPEEGDWYLWASANYPSSLANAFFVLTPDDQYVSGSGGTSADPAPFLDTNHGAVGTWLWGGAPGSDAINGNSMGAALGTLPAGEYTLRIFANETHEGERGGSGAGATASPALNPHIEMLYLSNGGADDRPSNAMFNAMQPASGARTLEPPFYPGFGGPIDVTVQVQPEASTGAATVVETVDPALRVDNVAATAGTPTLDGNVITWEIPALEGPETLTYTVFVDSGSSAIYRFSGTIGDGGIGGQADLSLLDFFIFETFAFPDQQLGNGNEGASVENLDDPLGGGNQPLDRGWTGPWTAGDEVSNALDLRIIDSGLVRSQPQEFNPGNFSLRMDGASGDEGLRRTIEPVGFGEVWVSFTFVDEGPAADHWAGLSFFDDTGAEQVFVGKPYNADAPGIGNLPGADSLAEGLDYTEPHHYLVRISLNSEPGANDSVSLWIDPDENDRLDTWDAQGADDIANLAQIRLARGDGGGSAWWDNIIISSVPALLPAGAGRAELPLEPSNPAAFDVISVDQLGDSQNGPPWGHDAGDSLYLIVSGYIYFENADGSGNQLVGYGLPPDRISGLNGHLLGGFNNQEEYDFDPTQGERNSLKFENNDTQRGPFTINIDPPGNYAELRAAMTVANGDGGLLATFTYADGSTEEGVFHADDWFNDPPNLDFDDVFQLVNGMNRLEGDNSFDDRFNPAVFENAAPVDPEKELVSVTLEFDTSVNAGAAYNLFSVVAIPPAAEPPTSVGTWMLH